jgi:hypothetical protein
MTELLLHYCLKTRNEPKEGRPQKNRRKERTEGRKNRRKERTEGRKEPKTGKEPKTRKTRTEVNPNTELKLKLWLSRTLNTEGLNSRWINGRRLGKNRRQGRTEDNQEPNTKQNVVKRKNRRLGKNRRQGRIEGRKTNRGESKYCTETMTK